jgi:hypothetical protein
MRQIIIFISLFLSQYSYSFPDLQFAPVFSIASTATGIQEISYIYSSGISVDNYLINNLNYSHGPGLKIMMRIPKNNGNNFVKVNSRGIYTETRYTWWFNLKRDIYTAKFLLGPKIILGADYISRYVDDTTSSSTKFLSALGARIGLSYWINNFGLEISYDISTNLRAFDMGHEINLAVVMHNK